MAAILFRPQYAKWSGVCVKQITTSQHNFWTHSQIIPPEMPDVNQFFTILY